MTPLLVLFFWLCYSMLDGYLVLLLKLGDGANVAIQGILAQGFSLWASQRRNKCTHHCLLVVRDDGSSVALRAMSYLKLNIISICILAFQDKRGRLVDEQS